MLNGYTSNVMTWLGVSGRAAESSIDELRKLTDLNERELFYLLEDIAVAASDRGYADGHSDGYDEGYDDGVEDQS